MATAHTITIVGIGPGNPSYTLPVAVETIKNARILVGGKRALADFAQAGQETFAITGNIASVMDFIRQSLNREDVTVMVSGDPGYYSLLDALRRQFPLEQLREIVGIGSLQFAFSRLARPWHDAALISFHGREPTDEQLQNAKHKVLGVLTDQERNSQTIAKRLLSLGWDESTPMVIAKRLSYEDEQITSTTLREAASNSGVGNCVLIIG